MATPGKLEKSWIRHKVIRDLAAAEMTKAAIARKYGVSTEALRLFQQRHVDDIAHVRDNLDDVFAGIVFADKTARLAELSDDVTTVGELLADPERAVKAGVQYAEMARVKHGAIRAIAEELGQLPSRMQVQVGGQLDVQVNGVELGDLK